MYTLTPGRGEEAGGSVRERGVLGPHLLAWLTWPSEEWAGEERFKAHVEEGETAAVQPDQGPEKGGKATTGTSGEQGQEPEAGPSPGSGLPLDHTPQVQLALSSHNGLPVLQVVVDQVADALK